VITTRLGEDIPGSEVVKIKSGGHYIQEDEPELLTSIIINFFNKNRRQ
jgi:pimeloyl-ACP methyl ester carboxylesterase